jgi:hypothetical protein
MAMRETPLNAYNDAEIGVIQSAMIVLVCGNKSPFANKTTIQRHTAVRTVITVTYNQTGRGRSLRFLSMYSIYEAAKVRISAETTRRARPAIPIVSVSLMNSSTACSVLGGMACACSGLRTL